MNGSCLTPTVLIVDDDQDTRSVFRRFLERANMRALTAGSGKECLAILQEQSIDLVVLDLMMPETNGISVLRCIRGDLASRVPVIIVTVWDDAGARAEAKALGASEYLIKPVFSRILLSKVQEQLKDRRALN